jgi:hypothetical protein
MSNLAYILETLNGGEDRVKLSREEKQQFIEAVKNFSAMGDSVYGKGNLQELTERVRDIVDKAQNIALQDEGWFDKMTINRHMKA